MSTTVLKNSSLIERLNRVLPDLELALDELRLYKQEKEKTILPSIPLMFQEVTSLAEEVLEGALVVSQSLLKEAGWNLGGPFAIVAMGKFGGRELTYNSDLDLIYFYKNPEDQEASTRLGQRIITALTVPTRRGFAYRVDTALRPSGNAGTLVTSLNSFQEYHRTLGRTWERQALIKARPILGPSPFLQEITGVIDTIVYQEVTPSLAGEIDHLRKRMENELARETNDRINLKTGRGGIVDIEFAVQYLQLVHGPARLTVRTPNTLEALETLLREGCLSSEIGQTLRETYLFYRKVESEIRRKMDQPTDTLQRGSEFWEECLHRKELTRRLYRQILQV